MAKLRAFGLLFLAGAAMAQSAFTSCEAAPSLAPDLAKAIAAASDPQMPFAARMAPFRALLERYPSDIFVNRAYLSRLGGYNIRPLYDTQLPRYEALFNAHPDDPAVRYLFALATNVRDPNRSKAMLEELVRQDPKWPWPHITLARLYGSIKPVDNTKSLAHLQQFVQICPETLEQGALETIAAGSDDSLKRRTVERLRKQLAGRADWQALRAWPELWEMEFQITPAAQHAALRTRVQQDVAALRKAQSESEDRKLDVMRQGATLANDMEGRRQIAAELMRVAPQSAAAADAAIEQWEGQNPYPDRSAAFAELSAYRAKRWNAGKQWTERWPQYDAAWRPALAALEAEDQDREVVAALGRRLSAFLIANPDATVGFTDQPILSIAQRLAAVGVDLDLVPGLLVHATGQAEARVVSDRAAAVRPFAPDEIERNFKSETWLIARTHAILQARNGDSQASRKALEQLLQQIDGSGTDTLLAWRGILAVTDAALLIKAPGLAREGIARMSSVLVTEGDTTPIEKRLHAGHEANYWQSSARLSELDGRSADAVAFYVRATNAIPRNFNPGGRSQMADLAEKAWIRLGGSPEAWQSYNPEAVPAKAEAQWSEVGRKMPEFSLEDSAGRPIRMADLNGKTVFINVWATWCGPCQGELPWVQKLYDAMKSRSDVAILTFNVDENPGVIAQFMREHSLSFPVVLARDFIDNTMKVEAIPRNWIVDARGMLRFERSAGFDDTFVKDTVEAMARAK